MVKDLEDRIGPRPGFGAFTTGAQLPPDEQRLAYLRVFEACVSLVLQKSQDYGTPDPARKDYFPFGDASYVHMLHTKTKRLVSLTKRVQEGKAVNFEGVDDTLKDLINYAMFYAVYRGIGTALREQQHVEAGRKP